MRTLTWLLVVPLAACQAPSGPAPVLGGDHSTLQLAPADEEASLAVQLADPDRAVQTLPASWDTASLRLEHASALAQARLRTLTKGVGLVSNGSGGYVANGTFGGLLRPRSGYTLYASLWNGGTSGTLAGEKKLGLTLVAGVNTVTLPIEVYPALGLSAYSPAAGIDGDTVTLTGQAFSVVPSNDLVTLSGLAATVSAAASVSLSVTVPDVGPGTYPWQIQVGGSLAARTGFNVLGTVGSRETWVSLSSHQKDPALAWGSDRYLIVWYDDRISGKTDVFGKFVDGTGTSLGSDFNITNTTTATQQRPYVAYNPATHQFLVVWQESPNGNDVQGQLVNADGTLSGGAIPLAVLSDAQTKPQVAYNSTQNEYLAVWTDHRNGNNDLYGQRVSAAGAMLGSNLALQTGSGNQDDVGVAFSGTSGKYLVVWKDDVPSKKVIRGNLLNADGTVAVGPLEISGLTGNDQVLPAVAADSTTGDFMVVWVENQASALIRGQRVSATGTLVGSPFTLSSASGAKTSPRLAYEPWRQKFIVVWNDNRNASTDVYGQYVSIGGSLWGGNFGVTTDSGNQTPCEVGASPVSKRGLVAFQDASSGGNIYGQLVR